ncbi:hypothetical protein HXX76_002177 [Chlamydomonas incerta]|uniref:Uncharacterized protein n=1 Tax=Chlamydomonas incerta TaxID=51695 RepID=A0A835WAK1_CHLIN|nr:hypothetical protein HXX76_002177 [Chlamydomonas incerta]|eukprot:KAG2443834.1 hypothetical protein HXX76_002177 [Chlamydomonas incerta]
MMKDAVKDAIGWRLDAIDGHLVAHGARLDAVDGRLDAIGWRLDAVDGRLDAIGWRLDAVDGRLDAVDGRLDAVDGRLDAVDRRLGAVQASVDKKWPDVRRLALPVEVKHAMEDSRELVDAINGAVLKPLLDKDTGILCALEVLFAGEGAPTDAAAIRDLRYRGCGLVQDKDKDDVRSRLEALQKARGPRLAQGLAADLGRIFSYLDGDLQARRDLLAGELFVRCAAALLYGGYTGVLEVDAGVAGGCEVNWIDCSLHISIGETKLNPAEVAPAEQQLASVGKVAAFTLDRALAAARSVAGVPRQVQKLPDRLFVQGVVLYVGQATRMQQQAEEEAGPEGKREELDGQVLSGAQGGLASATLVLRTASARELVR